MVAGVDISPLIDLGVPGLLLRHEDFWYGIHTFNFFASIANSFLLMFVVVDIARWNDDYFHIHHTACDTIDHVDEKVLSMSIYSLSLFLSHLSSSFTYLCHHSLDFHIACTIFLFLTPLVVPPVAAIEFSDLALCCLDSGK